MMRMRIPILAVADEPQDDCKTLSLSMLLTDITYLWSTGRAIDPWIGFFFLEVSTMCSFDDYPLSYYPLSGRSERSKFTLSSDERL